jgi:DNA-binding transcriptional ArsR family regulator
VIVRDGSRALRRSVRPVVWLVLEELALNVMVDGVVAASTSARAMAAELGLDPATTASALRVLRDRGLVELTRETGAAGRFGLSVYRLGPIPGVEVLAPCPRPPHVDGPHMVTSDIDGRKAPGRRTPPPRRSSPSRGVEQGALDFGLGSR